MAKKSPAVLKNFQQHIESVGRAWQKLLNLEHWEIRFEAAAADEMVNENAIGECWHHETDRRALISIRSTPDWAEMGPFYKFCTEDIEKCIIHELMHIILQDVSRRPTSRDVERTNNHLVDVIYALSKK